MFMVMQIIVIMTTMGKIVVVQPTAVLKIIFQSAIPIVIVTHSALMGYCVSKEVTELLSPQKAHVQALGLENTITATRPETLTLRLVESDATSKTDVGHFDG